MTNLTNKEAQYYQECCSKIEPKSKIFFWYSIISITSFSFTLLINFLINS